MIATDIKDTIQDHVLDAFDTIPDFQSSGVEISYIDDNTEQSRPDFNFGWSQIDPQESIKRTFGNPGNNLKEIRGVVTIYVRLPTGQGTGLATHIVSHLQTYFSNKYVTNLKYEEPVPMSDGMRVGRTWQTGIRVSFRARRRD